MLLRRKTHKGPVGPSCCHRLKLVSLFLGTGGSGESGFTWDIYALAFGGTDGWLSVGMSQGICLLHMFCPCQKSSLWFSSVPGKSSPVCTAVLAHAVPAAAH